MSGSRGGSGGAGVSTGVNGKGGSVNGGGMTSIPASAKKIVKTVKEIVNCPELEIYAMLQECEMDPNEAVNRLLAQDPFREVKSKREKKKECKDTPDSRSRGVISTSSRAGRGGTERYGRVIVSQFATSDPAASRGSKPLYKKDNEAAYTSSSSYVHGFLGSNVNQQQPYVSEPVMENEVLPMITTSDAASSFHPTSCFQSAWGVAAGQMSMADIVKRGRPQGKANVSHEVNCQQPLISMQPTPTPHEWRTAHTHGSKVLETIPDSGAFGNRHVPSNDEWPVENQPASSLPTISDPSSLSTDPSNAAFNLPDHQPRLEADEVRYVEDGVLDGLHASRTLQEQRSHGIYDDELYSYQLQQNEQQEAEDIATNIQQLNIPREEEEEDEEDEEDVESAGEASPAVKIPEHLQAQSVDCSHLSFGSFGSGLTVPFSASVGSVPAKSDVEETSTPVETEPVGHLEPRNTDYYGDEHLRTVSDEHVGHQQASTTGSYDMPSASQSEMLKQEASELSAENQYAFQTSTSNYGFENSEHLDASFSHPQAGSQMPNLPQLSGVMAYSSSLPSNLLASSVQAAREAELSYSPFPISQSTPNKYNGNASLGGSAISMTEALKSGNFSATQPTQNLLSSSSLSGGPSLPQHFPLHPFSQPSLPFPAANILSYPFLPQSYTYMPQSAFQQALTAGNNSTYHQSLAGVLPQYKNSVSVSSLPQSAAAAALASVYGAYGSPNSVSGGNFPLHAPGGGGVAGTPAPPATSLNYEDLLNSPYKEAAQMLALQQNETSPLWLQGGPGSRTVSALPASTFYSFQGQAQHQQLASGSGGYRQVQQAPPAPLQAALSQQYGNLSGYPSNFYQSNIAHDQHQHQLQQHHQQIGRDGSQGGQAQAPQAKQTQHQQIWQNTY